jgi:hypothetical protein
MDVVFDGLAKLWAQRAPRVEYNIVDLKELRKVRDERKMFAVINAAFDKAAAQNFGWPSSSGHNQF